MSDCILCDLLAGALPVSLVHQDERCTALMDIQPVNPGHVLVFPNAHAAYLAEMAEEDGAQVFRVAQRVALALRESGLRCEGVNLFLADGEAAGQEVFHVHLHVFPRFTGDGFGLKLPPGYSNRPERSELDAIALRIKQALGTPAS